jgi:hypothetical protein
MIVSFGMLSSRRLHLIGRGYIIPVIAVLSCSSCGGAAPSVPSSSLPAPTLSSPQDDAIAAGRPVLTVNNVAAATSAARTYDFQVADGESALNGPPEMLLASATGIAEGSNGRTSFQIATDLRTGRRYYWRARAVQSGAAGSWSNTFRFRTEATTNVPPVIQSMTVAPRAEAGTEVAVEAAVHDSETSPANLVYEWTAPGGSFAGSGATVRWLAPGVTGPTPYDLTLTVVERYSVAIDGGSEETRENRVTKTATVHVNDSTAEITTLARTFIDDFLHSDRSPEFCVRNFTDSCANGKRDELNDIRENRRLFLNDPAASSLGTGSIGFYDQGSSPRQPVPTSQSLFAEFLAPCRFASRSRATGAFGIAIGTCRLTHVYEDWQWRQCESHFLPASTSSPFVWRFPF